MPSLIEIGRFQFCFQCQPGCTKCCTQQGEVYLAAGDTARAAAYLGLTTEEFESSYCEFDLDGDLRLTTPTATYCHFLKPDGCAIHAAKPLQCHTFPYWPENVKNKRAWKNLKQNCPGIEVGLPLPAEEVRGAAQAYQDEFPDF